jgi:hypothetical protein
MTGNGQNTNGAAHSAVLHWTRRVLSVRDLHQSLNGHRKVVLLRDTVVTPLARDELRARGLEVTRVVSVPSVPFVPEESQNPLIWGYGQDRSHTLVDTAVQTLAREGVHLRPLQNPGDSLPCRWAKAVAECIARGECAGGVVFCEDPGLVCCVANKVPGLRAVAVTTLHQAARATLTLAANLLAVEMPGRTFFEIRQMLRTCCTPSGPGCPDGLACTLRELDGHAHR